MTGTAVVVSWALTFAAPPAQAQHQHHAPPSVTGGAAHFATSCKTIVADMFDRALGLLYAGAYVDAAAGFRFVTHSDVDCAIGAWGTAMAQWGRWDELGATDALDLGRQALTMAASMEHASPRERRYLAAAALLYDGAEREGGRNRMAYAAAMASLSGDFRDDDDAAILAARALLARPETQVTALTANRRRANAMIAGLPADHPGVVHETLVAGLDPERLAEAAGHAAHVLPPTAYALLLPAFAFERRGDWDAALEAAARAADTARRDGQPAEELRAQATAVAALLQLGRDAEAEAQARRAAGSPLDASAAGRRADEARFARAIIPVRLALERGDWVAAAALRTEDGAPEPVARLAALARAIGAARLGRSADARGELIALKTPGPPALAGLGAVAEAWTFLAEQQPERAVARLHAPDAVAADVAFAPLVPVQETLGEIALQLGDAAGALDAFQQALTAWPGRLRSLDGATAAAARAGRADLARAFLTRIVAQTKSASSPARPSILEARARLEALRKTPR